MSDDYRGACLDFLAACFTLGTSTKLIQFYAEEMRRIKRVEEGEDDYERAVH